MKFADQVRQFVAEHPGCTNAEIAKALNTTSKQVASFTSFMSIKAATPTLRRESIKMSITNTPTFGFWLSTDQAPSQEKPLERAVQSPQSKKSTLDTLVDQLASQLVSQLVGKVKSRLVKELERLIPTPQVEDTVDVKPLLDRLALPAPTVEKKDRLPRVGVVGLMPQQAGELSREFGEVMDLRFVSHEVHEMKSLKNCDVIFLHVKHMKHAHSQYLATFGVPMHNVNGGVSAMRQALLSHYAEV